jgi:general secretion pathway protein H
LVFVIAMPRFGFVSPQTELKSGAREVAAALREARSRAIVSNSEVQFNLDVEGHHFAISGDDQVHPLSGDIKLLLYTAQEEQGGHTAGDIRFFPDGSSTGGYVSLSAAKSSYNVTVDWLTGRVEIHPGEIASN